MAIDTGLKFLAAASALMTITLESRRQTLNSNVKVFVLKFLGAHYFFTF